MKTVKLLLIFTVLVQVYTSCESGIYVENEELPAAVSLDEVLNDYELWYVDIERTSGNGGIPFMEKAFTLSFDNGDVYANNNLVGIGNQGDGYGIGVGYYDTFSSDLDISHDLDGFYTFEVSILAGNSIELYNRSTRTSYILKGYQRHTFNYNRLFYDNIHYFLQEYAAWEKVYTSVEGAVNEFDEENYLQFLPAGGRGNFKSSQDYNGTAIEHVYWDYNGIYEVENVTGNPDLKYLSLDYDYFSGEFFELRVLDDNTISLYQPASGTEYRFRGRGYIAYKTAEAGKKREKQSVIDKQIKSIKL